MKTYRCAIVGLSGIASKPIERTMQPGRWALPYSHAAAYANIRNVQVVAVCDVVPAAIQRFRERWGGTWGEVAAYGDYRELLEREEIDILSVCTPDDKHADIVVDAADRGVRGIFCEKPLATNLADADRMIAAVERSGTILSVDHTRRWDPFFRRVKEVIDAGMIGQVRTIVGTLHGDRAMLFRNGTHVIDLICFYAGSHPVEVFAQLEEGFEGFAEYRGDGGHDPKSEPGASAYVRFANGVRAFYNGTKGTFANGEWDIVGSEGRIRINGLINELWTKGAQPGEQVCRPLPAWMEMKGAIQNGIEELLHVLEHGGQVSSTGRDARMTMEITTAMLVSQAQGNRLVKLPL